MPDWIEHKLESRLLGEISPISDMPFLVESEEELKRFLMKVKEENEKAGLKLKIRKMKIMAFSPITLWQIDQEKVVTVAAFIFLGSKITADHDCSHTTKRCFLLGRKARANLDNALKTQRCYFADKSPNSQSYGFSSNHVQMRELDHKEG